MTIRSKFIELITFIFLSYIHCYISMSTIDRKNAFLINDLAEEIYVEQFLEVVSEETRLMCELKTSFYWLKQSFWRCFDKFDSALLQFKMIESISDHLVFCDTFHSANCILISFLLIISSLLVSTLHNHRICGIPLPMMEAKEEGGEVTRHI